MSSKRSANNFTHILCVKLLNLTTNEILEDNALLENVKLLVTNGTQIERIPYNNSHDVEVPIRWKQHKINTSYKFVMPGDLIANINPDYDDTVIHMHTDRMLLGIETFLKTQFIKINDDKWSIIFYLSKPLATLSYIDALNISLHNEG
jgi:hypothetical protein